jgi:hypothetical protein
MIPTAKLFQNRDQPDRKQVGRDHLVPAGCMCVIILTSPGHATFQRAKWTESAKPVCHAPDEDTSRGVRGWHEIFALYLAMTPAVLSSIHPAPNPRRQFPNGEVHPTVTFPGAYNDNDPRSISGSPHTPGPLMSNLELLADMAVASRRVVVAMRDLIPIIHCESRIPSRRTRMDLVLVSSRGRSRH